MPTERIKWEQMDGWRNLRAEMGDYLLLISGGTKYQFHWAVFYKNNEIAQSVYPSRNVPEAQRTVQAIYSLAKNIL